LDLKKPLWEHVPCVVVTLVSKFHFILCLVAQESRLGRKDSVLNKNYAQFWVDRTSPSQFLDKSRTVPGGLVRFKGGLVRIEFFSSTNDYCFECNLLTISPSDFILLPLAS
jgi:hypothetical protein